MGLKYKGKIENPLDVVNKQYVEEHFIEKYEVIPTASADYENKIVQYIGITDINYTNAYFYKCEETTPSTDPKTYKWNKVPVQEIKDIVVFTEVDALPTTDIKDYTIYRLNKGSVGTGWKYKKFDNLNKDLYTTDYDGITEIATGTLTTWNDVNTNVTTKDNWEAKMEVTTFDEAQAVVTPDGYYPDFNHIIYHKNANTYEYWVYCGGVWKQFDYEGQIIQVDTMPTASSTLNGKIYQFVGNNTVDYTNGYFYKCIEDASTTPSTWLWVNIPVQQPAVTSFNRIDVKWDFTGSNRINISTDLYLTIKNNCPSIIVNHLDTAPWYEIYTQTSSTGTNWGTETFSGKIYIPGLSIAVCLLTVQGVDGGTCYVEKSDPVFEIVQIFVLPTASSDIKNKIYQYTGATNATYTNGYFYKCVEDTSTTPSTYKWVNVKVQSGGEIVDNLTSTDTNKALSANMGRELNDIKNVTSDIDKLVFKNMTQAEYDAATSHENEIVFITDSEPSSPSLIDDTQFVANKVLSSSKVKSMFEGFVGGLSYKVVATLPTTDIDDKVIYMVPTGVANEYNRWQYINSIWVDLGKTGEIDFSNYYNKTDVNNLLSEKVNTTDIVDNLSGSTESTKPLSAKQGNVLNNLKLNKSDISVDTATGVVTITY